MLLGGRGGGGGGGDFGICHFEIGCTVLEHPLLINIIYCYGWPVCPVDSEVVLFSYTSEAL